MSLFIHRQKPDPDALGVSLKLKLHHFPETIKVVGFANSPWFAK